MHTYTAYAMAHVILRQFTETYNFFLLDRGRMRMLGPLFFTLVLLPRLF